MDGFQAKAMQYRADAEDDSAFAHFLSLTLAELCGEPTWVNEQRRAWIPTEDELEKILDAST